jgi:hypothetical protein
LDHPLSDLLPRLKWTLGVEGDGETTITLLEDDGGLPIEPDRIATWPLRDLIPDDFRVQWPCFLVSFLPDQVVLGNIPVAGLHPNAEDDMLTASELTESVTLGSDDSMSEDSDMSEGSSSF